MPKNIVVCCDGTQNQFGTHNTNVVRLFMLLPHDDPATQVSFYDPGVGTMSAPWIVSALAKKVSVLLGAAFGRGISRNVAEAYVYLMNAWQPGDRIYLFGFSRGAYTVRVLSGLLRNYGLLEPGSENQVDYLVQLYQRHSRAEGAKRKELEKLADEFKCTFSRECKPHFLGVWDTVSSVGWSYAPVTFANTAWNPDVAHVRHAISIDERRVDFRQNLAEPAKGQDCVQVWFAGVHSDVGGGYANETNGLSILPLKWMLGEAKLHGMRLDEEGYAELLARPSKPHSDPSMRVNRSLTGFWYVLQALPHRAWRRTGARSETGRPIFERELVWPAWGPRTIEENAILHHTVLERMRDAKAKYAPANLPKRHRVLDASGSIVDPNAPAKHELDLVTPPAAALGSSTSREETKLGSR